MSAPDALRNRASARARNRGFSMLEVLISMLIIQVGLLGLVGTQVVAQRAESEAYQRAQAVILLNDMVERINANRYSASCFAFTSPTAGTPYLGGSSTEAGHFAANTCTIGSYAMADQSMQIWDRELQGSAEKIGTNKVGAITSARGCVSSFVIGSGVGTGITEYVVAVVWQGQTDSFSPNLLAANNPTNTALVQAAACGTGLYGADDAQRRMVYTTLEVAELQ